MQNRLKFTEKSMRARANPAVFGFILGVVLGVVASTHYTRADDQVFIERDMFVLDLMQNVEWLRCSLGQVWDGETCQGEVMKLNHDEIMQAIAQANEQLGGDWRYHRRMN